VLGNTGQKTLTGMTVQVVFLADDGSTVKMETVPVRLVRQKEPYVDLQPMSAEPLKPGTTHEFRLIFENLPETWNIQVPQIRIVHTDWQ